MRANLSELYQQSGATSQVSEDRVREILQDVRERLQPAVDGELTAHPVFTALDMGNLAEGTDDARWSLPFSLLHSAALLFRTAATDPAFDRAFKFSTFDRQAFLEAMNVFSDPIAIHPDAERANQEIQQLDAVASSPVSLLEKCRLIWGLIKGAGASNDPPPPTQVETGD